MHTIHEETDSKGRTYLVVTCSCGKSQRLKATPSRRKQLSKFNSIWCGKLACEDRTQVVPEGVVRVVDFYAAGGFQGWYWKLATPEEMESINRAKALRDMALQQLGS
jgi:hypothetical protein